MLGPVMPFAVAHTVELAGTATPEPSPNAQPPLAPRRFPSPPIGTGQVHAAVGWTEGAGAPVSFELWVLAAPLTKWFRAGTRTTTADGEPADGIIVPAEAELVVRVTAAPVVGALRFGFRAPAADDAVSAGDVAELPDPIVPGDADPNDPATYVLARIQAYDRDADAWIRARIYGSELFSDSLGIGVRFLGEGALRDTAGATTSIDAKMVVGVPGTDNTNDAIPYTGARLQGLNPNTGRWAPVLLHDPAMPDVPLVPGGIETHIIDFPNAVRVQLIDAATGNSSLFFSGVPAPDVSGFAVRIVPSGETSTRNSQAVVLAREMLTGYSEQRVVNPRHIFGFTAGPVEDTSQLGYSGTGTHQAHAATLSQEIAVSGVAGVTQSFETHTCLPLPANTPIVVRAVAAMSDAGQANQVRLLRFGSATDYAGIRLNGTDPEIVVVTALYGTTTIIPRFAWFDPLDGTGPSTAVIDWTEFNTFELTVAGPGANLGAATINGVPVAYVPANIAAPLTLLWSSHPVGASITNTGPSVAGHIRVRSISAHVLGDRAIHTQVVATPLMPVSKTVTTTLTPVLSIRPAEFVNGVANRRFYMPRVLFLTNTGGRLQYEVWRQGTLTAPSWTPAGGASGLEFDTAATAFSTVGARPVFAAQLSETRADAIIPLDALFEEHWSNVLRMLAFGGGRDTLTVAAKAAIGSAGIVVSMVTDEVGA